MKKLLLSIICISTLALLQAFMVSEAQQFSRIQNSYTRVSTPFVSNVTAVQRLDGSKTIDIYYDLAEAGGVACTVSLKISHNEGASFALLPTFTNLSGDIGSGITPGTGKHITWNAGAEPYYLDGSFIYRVEADNSLLFNEFVMVTTSGNPLLIATTEVTQASYQHVMGTNPSYNMIGPEYPVHNVSYWDAVRYCNQRSWQEGLIPYYEWKNPLGPELYVWPIWPAIGSVYTEGGAYLLLQQHYSLGVRPRTSTDPTFFANGYRLLTEAEWEFAARGGLETGNFVYSGSNVADSVAWYSASSSNAVHPVAEKAPNELGLYDMSGNVQEWVFDMYSQNYIQFIPYTTPAFMRWTSMGLCKGGWWATDESTCIPAYRYLRQGIYTSIPMCPYANNNNPAGFRICRSVVSDTVSASITFNPPGLSYDVPVQVSITCSNPAANITYTTDGTEPVLSSTPYTIPFTLHHTTILKARAFLSSGSPSSGIVQETYTILLPSLPEANMIHVDGGVFNNGVSDVTLNSFYIGESEIRQSDFYPLMGGNPPAGFDLGLNYPAVGIDWFQAIEYCNKRSIAESLIPCYIYGDYGTNPNAWPEGWNSDGNQANILVNWYTANGYRLPTEMEWMFAARGGNLSQDYPYSGSETLDSVGWYDANSGLTPHPAMSLTPNELVLYDMSGNAGEWCWDIKASAYPADNQINPIGAETGSNRIVRGGSYNNTPLQCTTEHREGLSPSSRTNSIGFRVCRQIAATTTLGEVQFSHPSGLYSEMIEVTLTSPNPQTKIRYTINGSTPSEYYGYIFSPSQPIRLYSNVTLKAVAYTPGYLCSVVAEAVYTFSNDQPEGFVFIEGGTFSNGVSDVFLSSYFIADAEITQAQYQSVMSVNPATGYGAGADYPVYYVSWLNAVEYCNRRSIQEGIQPCYTYLGYGANPDTWPTGWLSAANHTNISLDINKNGYRLPTEMEWMYSAQGGSYSQNYSYCGGNTVNAVSWCLDNANNTNHPVGTLLPNELGLFDMGGNIWEWCWDILAPDYTSGSQINPLGPETGSNRVLRGASSFSSASQCTPFFRNGFGPASSNHACGIRVCKSATDIYTALTTPDINPLAGIYDSEIHITLSGSTPGAQIRYTTDGTDPSESLGTLYNTPIFVYRSTTIKAIAYRSGFKPSPVLIAEYTISDSSPLPTPVFSLEEGYYEVALDIAISCSALESQIRFTTDGTEPTREHGTLYTNRVYINQDTILKAIAYRIGGTQSAVATAVYAIDDQSASGLTLVEGGTFPNGTSNVTVSSFYAMSSETTQASYQAIMGTNPSIGFGEGADYPAYNVNWFDAVKYCNLRSMQDGLNPAYSFGTYGTNPNNWPLGWNLHESCEQVGSINMRDGSQLVTPGTSYTFFDPGGPSASFDADLVNRFTFTATDPSAVISVSFSDFALAGYRTDLLLYDGTGVNAPQIGPTEGYTGTNSPGTIVTTGSSLFFFFRSDSWPHYDGWSAVVSAVYPGDIAVDMAENGYRLPTEMEWMFAARGGNLTQGYTYCGGNDINAVAWHNANSANTTHPTATLNPNELGLYDMSGNVWEWCWDNYAAAYPSGEQTNPTGPGSGYQKNKVFRGGSAFATADQCTPAYRHPMSPVATNQSMGFRVIRSRLPVSNAVPTPVITPETGVYDEPQTISISCSSTGAAIYYTTDGTEPDNTSILYNAPFQVITSTTIKARAYRYPWEPSSITTAAYTITGSVPAGFVLVEGGTFNNGTSNVASSNFYMDSTEVTQGSYTAVMGNNPAIGFGTGDAYPVYKTSWFNAVEYCNRRSISEGLTPVYNYNNGTDFGTNPANWPANWNTLNANQNFISANWATNGYRLPNEMEWMFAARGGNLSMGYTYCGSNDSLAVAWFKYHSNGSTHPTAQLQPNELGLYDMSGNVWEWCWDYHADNYPAGDQTDPTGPVSGQYRMLRGASAFSPAYQGTPIFRNWIWPTYTEESLGFRVVLGRLD
ncbi:MAG: SUMF1/EgtB/PvdO family nonheme iron enzyme [Candidatus Cloacimonas sp.]|jgi:formylglycine-generating enzyme required for sulfatase activity|nr:SUMF1/EgtB/PvdO family nonheme iron enzyme [Candidatus Cloacimonas sp.]